MIESGSSIDQLSFHRTLKNEVGNVSTLLEAEKIICSAIDSVRQQGFRIAFLSGPVTGSRRENLAALALQTQQLAEYWKGSDIIIFSCEIAEELVGDLIKKGEKQTAYAFWNGIVRGNNERQGVDILAIARNPGNSIGTLGEAMIAHQRGIPVVTIDEVLGQKAA